MRGFFTVAVFLSCLSAQGQHVSESCFVGHSHLNLDRASIARGAPVRVQIPAHVSRARFFGETMIRLRDGVEECIRSRRLAGPALRVLDYLPNVRAHCEWAHACAETPSALACYDEGAREIRFQVLFAFFSPETWFHELMHAAGVDNQSVENHVLHQDTDEIYFWEEHCFRPIDLYDARLRGDDRCRAVLGRALESSGRRRYSDREVEVVCGLYDQSIERFHEVMRAIRRLRRRFPEVERTGRGALFLENLERVARYPFRDTERAQAVFEDRSRRCRRESIGPVEFCGVLEREVFPTIREHYEFWYRRRH